MLKLVFILLACFPILTSAQQKKDSEIIVVPRDSVNLYNQVESLLKTEGYKLGDVLNNKTLITTKPRTIGRRNGIVSIYQFRITSENTILVSGHVLLNMLNPSDQSGRGAMYSELYYDDYKRALRKEPWQEMDRLAKLLGTVTYTKKEKINLPRRRRR
jgi:hypothetical protein